MLTGGRSSSDWSSSDFESPARPATKKKRSTKSQSSLACIIFFFGAKKHKIFLCVAGRARFLGNTIPFLDVLLRTTMPVKRKYGETLTGGTGDVNPQSYTVAVDLPAVTGTGVVQFPLPIPRYPGSQNRAVVMELLSVEWYMSQLQPSAATGDTYNIVSGLSTNPGQPTGGTAILTDPRTVSVFRRQFTTLTSTAVGFQIFSPVLEEYDELTDQAGHGVLIATDNVYVRYSLGVTNYTPPDTLICKMNYRMKEVGLSEYIGIVTSQQ